MAATRSLDPVLAKIRLMCVFTVWLLRNSRVAMRAAFSYGAAHWFTGSIVAWAIANQVSQAAITDGLIFMAIVMVIVRTAGLAARAFRLPE